LKLVQIRSFVKGGNHGQFLQALGLANLLEKLLPNHKITHLNYENHFFKELKIQIRSGMLPKFLMMRYYWNKYLKFSSINNKTDLSVYGSDMIWHLDSKLFSPDPILFGKNDNSKHKISYAPSTGYRIQPEPSWIKKYLNDFNNISVRDYTTANFVKDHSSIKPNLAIDPCFHLINSKFSKWFINIEKQNFLSVYSPQPEIFLNAFNQNLDFKKLPSWIKNYIYLGYFPRSRLLQDLPKQLYDPLWTLKKISQSKLLITTTFHGVMMALMTKTPFIAVTNPNLSARLDSPIAETFSKKRLITIEEFKELTSSKLLKFFSEQDIDELKIKKYLISSESWIKSSLIESKII